MGSKAARMKRMKAEHPFCYFCATAPTETEDHVPSRECFRDRVGPEGFAFPACRDCNNSAGRIEQAVALYIMLADHSAIEPSSKQMVRLVQGVRNNTPELLPAAGLSARAAREHFRRHGITLAQGATYRDTPMLQLPRGSRSALERFARRLTCALFYKEAGRPLPRNWIIGTGFKPISEPGADDIAQSAMQLFPELRLTNRRNTDIGDQFSYVWGYHHEGTLFGAMVQFSRSFLVFCCAVDPSIEGINEHWKSHESDLT